MKKFKKKNKLRNVTMKESKKSNAKGSVKKTDSKKHLAEKKQVKESAEKTDSKKNLKEKKSVNESAKKNTKTTKKQEKSANYVYALLAILFIGLGLFLIISLQDSTSDEIPTNENIVDNDIVESQVVATVDGQEITSDEVMSIVEMGMLQGYQVSQEDALDQAIIVAMLTQEAEENNLLPTTAETEDMIRMQLEQTGSSIDELNQHIAMQGISYEQLVEDFRKQMGIQAYLELKLADADFEVSQEEAMAFYEMYAALEELPPFEEVENEIMSILMEEKQQEVINELINEVRESKEIVFY